MVGLDDLRLDLSHKTESGLTVGETLKKLEFQRQERLSLVPTLDEDVRAVLRWLNKDVVIEGEDNLSRRERLAELLYSSPELLDSYKESPFYVSQDKILDRQGIEAEDEEEEEFYTPASSEFVNARKDIVQYSLARANRRLQNSIEQNKNLNLKEVLLRRRELNKRLKLFELTGTQLLQGGPVSQVAVSPDGKQVITGDWSGQIRILDSQSLELQQTYENGHSDKIGGLDWDPTGQYVLSGAADCLLKLWDTTQSICSHEYSGHTGRVARVKFHPSGKYAASASFDMTWAFWDLEKQVELLSQEGHSKEVFNVCMNGDGSLLASAGLDSIGLIWDLRSGESIMVLDGHEKSIYGLDWSPNGYQVATASADGTIKIWDLRKLGNVGTILAHNSAVVDVRFDKENRPFLISGGYDGKVNIYSSYNWKCQHTLEGHTGRVMSVDISNDLVLYSSGWDRSVKRWTINDK
ncbi:HDL351Wp [Eremothecium sinecaudum]|uniref:HDL351Wp n=1 Tax=Eremothecium sinecaudum TaxID=45286 RepID=A0A0X8HS46_9SACH|nr:HDL351Wp [Eremothecium sinecaudum]AMD20393.1 HDL351Wp [Eremothecium sinecaudum]